jgi:2-polyprenyl-6-methoxyphenol hydroxylase-like FAD-dependent oxidoreductase
MAVGRGGYVGLVRVEGGALNVAGAFDSQLVRESRGPALAAARVLAQAGFPAIPALAEAEWLGTPALSRSTTPVAAERLFVLGDASGYIEPFTGEGMLWALASAVSVAPLASTACDDWQPSLAEAWSREHARIVRTRQRTCRMLAALLKSPTCVRLAMFLLPKMPSLLRPVIRGVSLPTPHSLAITRSG